MDIMWKIVLICCVLNCISTTFGSQTDDIPIMQINKIELESLNYKYGDVNLTLRRLSRKDFSVSTYLTFYQNLPEKIFLHLELFALFSNTYRKMPLEFDKEVCALYNNEFQLYRDNIEEFGHIPEKCPIAPGDYYLKDYIFDAGKLPAIPWKKIKTQSRIYFEKNETLAIIKIEVTNNQEYVDLLKKSKIF